MSLCCVLGSVGVLVVISGVVAVVAVWSAGRVPCRLVWPLPCPFPLCAASPVLLCPALPAAAPMDQDHSRGDSIEREIPLPGVTVGSRVCGSDRGTN